MAAKRKRRGIQRPGAGAKWYRQNLKLPVAHRALADELALILGMTRTAYMKDALIRQMMADWALTPGRGFWVRPGAPVYRLRGTTLAPVASALGGERVWVRGSLGSMPKALGGSLALLCDIVAVGMKQGLTMTDAVIARESIGGPCANDPLPELPPEPGGHEVGPC